MNFTDALHNLLNGKMMARPQWGGGIYVAIFAQQTHIWRLSKDNSQSTNSIIFTPTIEDLLATDWFVKY